MRIVEVETWRSDVPLSRPYTIATRTVSAVELFFVRIRAEDGTVGIGSGSPVRASPANRRRPVAKPSGKTG